MTPSHTGQRPSAHVRRPLGVGLLLIMLSSAAYAEVRSVAGLEFSRVHMQGSNQLEISSGDSNTLKIRGEQQQLEPPPFVLDGDTLYLGVSADGRPVADLKFRVTVVQLEELAVAGSGEAFVKPIDVPALVVSLDGSGAIRLYDVTAPDLELQLVGSGELQAAKVQSLHTRLQLKGGGDLQLGELQTQSLKVHLAGSGDVTLEDESRVSSLDIGLLGSGDVALERLTADAAKVSIVGSGDVAIQVREQLDAEIMGSGDLLYRGDPTVSKSILGSGEVTKKED